MEKRIVLLEPGSIEQVGPDFRVRRVLPTRMIRHIDPFLFLDHLLPLPIPQGTVLPGTGPHPHRGIITFSYLLSGEMEHYDSYGHHGIVSAGGFQMMNSGNGIVHDEKPSNRFTAQGGELHGFQIWISLPASQKKLPPSYLQRNRDTVPEVHTPEGVTVRVLLGAYGSAQASVPVPTPMFLYHLQLPPESAITLTIPEGFNSFAYAPQADVLFGANQEERIPKQTLARFSDNGASLTLKNPDESKVTDILLFGGQPIAEPIVMYGPFVMNSMQEIQAAYDDYRDGKYGEIQI